MNDALAADVRALVADLLPVLLPQARLDGDSVVIPVKPGERARVRLDSLIGGCAEHPQHRWPRLVDDWLRQVAADVTRAAESADTPDDIRDRLRLRLVPRVGDEAAAHILSLPYGGYFDALYVIDRPDRVEYLTPELAARLGPEDQLRQIAVTNTVQRELMTFDVRDHAVTPTESVRLVAKDGSQYVPTGLMTLHRYFAGPAPHGALVSVPRYSAMLIHEIASPSALDFINVFHDMTRSSYDSAGDRCTPQVFWWVSGDLHAVTVTATEDAGRRRVDLPPALQPVVAQLRAG